jgi:hypothetical protein
MGNARNDRRIESEEQAAHSGYQRAQRKEDPRPAHGCIAVNFHAQLPHQ